MTKQVRIENADTSNWPVRVTIEHKDAEGNWVAQPGPVQINNPCQVTEQYLTSHRRIVIEERAADTPAA
ncbi:MAG: hypothetical protein K2W93_12925 [Burkholderiaceae bacterium]|nr:hypothetical protein [Burkholderiaceae bacterium]